VAFKKASFMTDASLPPESPDVTEIASFLRRFADLMSNGYNATYLHRAADMVESLTARVTAASDEEKLWRYKYETVTRHADALEAECDTLKHDVDTLKHDVDTLKHDVEGHMEIAASILGERDALKAALQEREAEIAELEASLSRERGEAATTSEQREQALTELQVAFDREREALEADAKARREELAELRQSSEREREDLKAAVEKAEQSLAELRLARDREQAELQVRLKVSADELAALHTVSRRERDELQARVASLEDKRAALRMAFERISDLRSVEASEKPAPEAVAPPLAAQPGDQTMAISETSAVVPKATLRQARAQFEYLAKQCIPRGDIASQVMCELGAHTMDLALTSGGEPADLPVGEMALSILAPNVSAAPATV
jgi:chromosome segregation ATPase